MRQIVLIDAPSVLGWQTWRGIEPAQHGFRAAEGIDGPGEQPTQGAISGALVESHRAHAAGGPSTEVAMLITPGPTATPGRPVTARPRSAR